MQSKFKNFIGAIILIGFIITIIGSAASQRTRTVKEEPGWYGISYSDSWNGGHSDIDGKIGYPLYVSNPKARCAPSGNWTANTSIVSGTLPPGLTLNSAPSTITGTPTERGHWKVTLRKYNIICNGSSYKDFEQELRFHITGSGKVND